MTHALLKQEQAACQRVSSLQADACCRTGVAVVLLGLSGRPALMRTFLPPTLLMWLKFDPSETGLVERLVGRLDSGAGPLRLWG